MYFKITLKMKLAHVHEREIKMRATVAKFTHAASFIYFTRSTSEPVKAYPWTVCVVACFLKELLPSLFTYKNIDNYQEGQI